MTERASERAVFGKRFHTGHEVIDEVVSISHGSTILMLDQTFSEAKNFLYTIFDHYGNGRFPIEITSRNPSIAHERIVDLPELALSDVSISVNNARQKFIGEPIIHSYIPDLLIRNAPEDVLKFVEAWQRNVVESNTVEFYLLPIGAFAEVEKKMLAIVDGAVEIRTEPTATGFTLTFSPIRICKPEWHLKPFPYRIEEDRLLVKWEGEFTDKLPRVSPEEIASRVEGYRREIERLVVRRGYKTHTDLPIADYALYSQIENVDLMTLSVTFPERFDEILKKIAKWHIDGLVTLERVEEPVLDVTRLNLGKPISVRSRLMLTLPRIFRRLLVRLRIGEIRKMPVDMYTASKKASVLILSQLLGENEPKLTQSIRQMNELEKRVSEAAAREAGFMQLQRLGEDVTARLDAKYVATVIELTLFRAFGLGTKITQASKKEYTFSIENCFICERIKAGKPVCTLIEGTVEGIVGIVFKTRGVCEEVRCKALNDDECAFRLRLG